MVRGIANWDVQSLLQLRNYKVLVFIHIGILLQKVSTSNMLHELLLYYDFSVLYAFVANFKIFFEPFYEIVYFLYVDLKIVIFLCKQKLWNLEVQFWVPYSERYWNYGKIEHENGLNFGPSFTSDSDSDSDSDSVWVWFWFWFSVWFQFRRC